MSGIIFALPIKIRFGIVPDWSHFRLSCTKVNPDTTGILSPILVEMPDNISIMLVRSHRPDGREGMTFRGSPLHYVHLA